MPSEKLESSGHRGRTPVAKPFALSDVRLIDPAIRARQESNQRYLLSLDADRLLHNFRVNAGLPSAAQPLGGWEAPACGLRGHFVGHYLSACAHMCVATGDETLRDRATLLVTELGKCQAKIGSGYLSAFPESELGTIETKFDIAWAPYYTLHKILAGLIHVHRHFQNAESLAIAIRLANYIRDRFDKIPPERLESVLRTDRANPLNEFGGMYEVLHDLYDITQDSSHLKLAQIFDREWFIGPLMRGEDQLANLHCNTHIPIVIGAMRHYELTGDARYKRAAEFFWERTALARSYVNGGSSGPRPLGEEKSKGAEHWPEAFALAATLSPKINESCVTHNMMRLTDLLFRWTADARYAEFYERAYLNSVLCMQHPRNVGEYIYDHPLDCDSQKKFGHADDAFWCCYGTGIEAFGRLANGIYYHNDENLWVNLFVASELNWKAKGLRVAQSANLPADDLVRFVFRCDAPDSLTVHLPFPKWADSISLTVNGEAVRINAAPGSFVPIKRVWRDGDAIKMRLEMRTRTESMPDDPKLVAMMYGPFVLAVRSDAPLALVPLNQIVDERFGVYFRVATSAK